MQDLITLDPADSTCAEEISAIARLHAEHGVNDEIETCRTLARRAIFIVGYARSSTTLLLEMLNARSDVYMLGEAHFFFPSPGVRFACWFNEKHHSLGNSKSKSAHAADYLPGRSHYWWEWLREAGEHFERIGDKIALSSHFLQRVPPEQFLSFFEARFHVASYLFLLRNPLDAVASHYKLQRFTSSHQALDECEGYLRFAEIWAAFVATFPRTLTLTVETLENAAFARVGRWLNLDLAGASKLYSPSQRNATALPDELVADFASIRGDFDRLYEGMSAIAGLQGEIMGDEDWTDARRAEFQIRAGPAVAGLNAMIASCRLKLRAS